MSPATKPPKRSRVLARRIAAGVAVICATVTAPIALAAGKPGNFKLAPTSPETVSGDRAESVVAAKLDDEPGTDLALVNTFTSVAILSAIGIHAARRTRSTVRGW